mgnify:CR=1 FL=1
MENVLRVLFFLKVFLKTTPAIFILVLYIFWMGFEFTTLRKFFTIMVLGLKTSITYLLGVLFIIFNFFITRFSKAIYSFNFFFNHFIYKKNMNDLYYLTFVFHKIYMYLQICSHYHLKQFPLS